jgi:multimeric flavodoxin WrbA
MIIESGQIYLSNVTGTIHAILEDTNSHWDFLPLTVNKVGKQFSHGGNWPKTEIEETLKKYYTFIGHLKDLDFESYFSEKDLDSIDGQGIVWALRR